MTEVILNGRFLSQRLSGVQRSAHEIVAALDTMLDAGRIDPGRWRLILATPPRARTIALKRIATEPVGQLRGHLWEQVELSRRGRGRTLVSFANTGPLARERQIVTIHDASVFAVPEAYTLSFRTWYRLLLPMLGRRAARVVTDSEFSKQELARFAGIDPGKIDVIPLGKEHILSVAADPRVLERHQLRERRYLLAVSSLSPHKNFARLTAAIDLLDTGPCEVVVVGATNPRIFRAEQGPGSIRVKWVGYVPDSELRALYERAIGLVYPSLYEGFGLPPLEAMACGCPVIASRAASLPEVCGDAVLYCEPTDPADIARAMTELLGDEKLQERLRSRGLERAKEFTWERAAARTLKLIEQVAS